MAVFTILCAFSMVIGFLTFVFGLIDRIGIQMMISFLMLPVWNGMLFGTAGLSGLVIGRQNKRQGYISSGMTSGLKAIHMLCFGLSLLTFYMYGSVLMYIGFRIEMDFDSSSFYYPTNPPTPPKQPSTNDGTPDDDTRQGIFAMIIIFSLVEMFLGAWIVMLEKEKMVFGSQSSADQAPLITSAPNQYIQPAQYAQRNAGMVVASPQVQQQQQQQPVYFTAPGSNVPIHQQQQRQHPQPQYVLMQNPLPNAPPPQVMTQGDPSSFPSLPVSVQEQPNVRTDSPVQHAGDVHSPEIQRSGVKE